MKTMKTEKTMTRIDSACFKDYETYREFIRRCGKVDKRNIHKALKLAVKKVTDVNISSPIVLSANEIEVMIYLLEKRYPDYFNNMKERAYEKWMTAATEGHAVVNMPVKLRMRIVDAAEAVPSKEARELVDYMTEWFDHEREYVCIPGYVAMHANKDEREGRYEGQKQY